MTESLIEYVENEIIPRYRDFDAAHRESHARDVIARGAELLGWDLDKLLNDTLEAMKAFA